MRRKVKRTAFILACLLIFLKIGDLATTYIGIQKYGIEVESNPASKALIEQDIGLWIWVNMATTCFFAISIIWAVEDRITAPLAYILAAFGVVFYTVVVLQNYFIIVFERSLLSELWYFIF